MLIFRATSVNAALPSSPCGVAWLAVVVVVLCGCCEIRGFAQLAVVEAFVTRADQGATVYNTLLGNLTPTPLKRNDKLRSGDVLESGLKGRIVIAISDGSQVIIYERSRVALQDFQNAGSWRDLLTVTSGRIRATINHGKRPNHYRVFSPVASIAVRGTIFMVIVESSRQTQVIVFEGLVEVDSLVRPQQPVLVRPGSNVIVRTDGDISLVTAAPRGERNELRSLQRGGGLEYNLSNAFNTRAETFFELRARPSRFTAFADSHLDSLQNPAYAGEFQDPSGRFFLIPSFSPETETKTHWGNRSIEIDGKNSLSSNYTASTQVSYFVPLGSKFVAGGGAAITNTEVGGTDTEGPYPGGYFRDRYENYIRAVPTAYFQGTERIPADALVHSRTEGSAKFAAANLTLILARRIGRSEQTNVGMKFDYQEDRSSFSIDETYSGFNDYAQESGKAPVRRLGFTVGLTRNFGADKKLGVYYRFNKGDYKFETANIKSFSVVDLEVYFQPGNTYRSSRGRTNHLSEGGVRFRGAFSRRLFYGLEGSISTESHQSRYRTVYLPNTGESEYVTMTTRLNSAAMGGGLGLALRRRTVFSADFSAAGSQEGVAREYQSLPGNYKPNDHGIKKTSWNWALHSGGQTDLWWNFFVGASRLWLRERTRSAPSEYFIGDMKYEYTYTTDDRSRFTNVSLGYRFTPSWIGQYTYFTNRRVNAPSHTFMLRYQFGSKPVE